MGFPPPRTRDLSAANYSAFRAGSVLALEPGQEFVPWPGPPRPMASCQGCGACDYVLGRCTYCTRPA